VVVEEESVPATLLELELGLQPRAVRAGRPGSAAALGTRGTRGMSRGMLRDARRDARLRAAGVGTVVVPVLALGVLAALAYSGLGAGARRGELEQVGEEFVDPLKSETPADMALKIQGILKREAVLLKKISERAKLRQRVQVDVTAGQIGKMGPRGPKGYTGARGFQGPRGSTGVCPSCARARASACAAGPRMPCAR